MKRFITLSTTAILLTLLASCSNNNNNEPAPTQQGYSIEYKLSILTNQAGEKGRSLIVEMAENNLRPFGWELKQMSESVWGVTIPYGNDSILSQKEFNELSNTVICTTDSITEENGFLFYGQIQETKRLIQNKKKPSIVNDYFIMSPKPDEYRYVINRNTWDVKWFEYNKNSTPLIETHHTGCLAQVTTDSGEQRNAHFTAEGVEIYRAGSNTEIEATIRYSYNHNKVLQATLTVLEGSVVNMPITLEKR